MSHIVATKIATIDIVLLHKMAYNISKYDILSPYQLYHVLFFYFIKITMFAQFFTFFIIFKVT